MVSLGSFLVTSLTVLTTVFSEDLISLTITSKRMIERVEVAAVQQIFDILCPGKGEEGSQKLSHWISALRLYSSLMNCLNCVLSCCSAVFHAKLHLSLCTKLS